MPDDEEKTEDASKPSKQKPVEAALDRSGGAIKIFLDVDCVCAVSAEGTLVFSRKKNVVRGGKKRERKARRSNGKSKRQCRLDKRLKRQTVVRRPCVTNTSQLPTFIAFICRRKKNLPPSKSIRLYEKSPRSICRKIIKQMIRFSKSEKKGQRLVVPNWRCEFPRILFEISLQLTLYFFLCWKWITKFVVQQKVFADRNIACEQRRCTCIYV